VTFIKDCQIGWTEKKQQVPPLRFGRDDNHVKINKVTAGRDDNSVAGTWPQKRSDEWLLVVPQNCHPDRSVAEWRDLRFLYRFLTQTLSD